MPSKPLILLDKKYFYLMFTWQMFICIIGVLSLIRTAFHKTINILEDISMSNKYFLKKSWVNVDVCIEDYHNSGTTLEDLQKIKWSPYSNIISREVKKTRHTIEEIDEKTYKEKVEKSNGLSSEAKAVSVKDCKE
tara:strand:+ start:298 stop:702 length:405 start_codon:yes stop_codon:yes gene_type:complete